MNAVDTNVLIYRLDRHDPIKQAKARDLLHRLARDATGTVLLWQVLGETVRQLRAWQDAGRLSQQAMLRYATSVRNLFPLVTPTPNAFECALELARRYSLSHWDSMLLGACVDAGVETLFTEDMGAPTTIADIRLVNPFV